MRIVLPHFNGLRLLLKGPVQTSDPVTLTHKRIFILPTGLGLVYGLMVLAMLGVSINYANNLGYAVSFTCLGVALVSLLHTHRNLSGLKISPGKCDPVFAGQRAAFHLLIQEDTGRPRPGIQITAPENTQSIDLPGQKPVQVNVLQKTHFRGLTSLQEVRIFTVYPWGLFRAWSRIRPKMHCLVYPRPVDSRTTFQAFAAADQSSLSDAGTSQVGVEEFAGMDEYRPGESAKRIDWKAYARGQGLVVREFAEPPAEGLIFDFNTLPQDMGTEERLSVLCRLVLDAHISGRAYGLRLPGTDIGPGQGGEHQQECLEALAVHDVSES